MSNHNTYQIDPDAVLDYSFDWTLWLAAGETIATKTIVPSSGITVTTSSITAGVVTIWVTGATPVASTQTLTCRITTDQGRTDDRTISLVVTNR